MLSCFVSKDSRVSSQKEAENNEFRFNFETRTCEPTFCPNRFSNTYARWANMAYPAAQDYFDKLVGTPEKLMDFVAEGKLSKMTLASLLVPEKRKVYLETCAAFELALTKACREKGDPCLADGCSMEDGEACLNAVLEAGDVSNVAYSNMWTYLFRDPANRINVWRK